MAIEMRREWVAVLAGAGLLVNVVLYWARIDAGMKPVHPLTAPAIVPRLNR